MWPVRPTSYASKLVKSCGTVDRYSSAVSWCRGVDLGCSQVFENLVDIQKELSLSVQELMKLQKIYKEEEHVTHDACIKAADADDKLVVYNCSAALVMNET